MLCSTRAHSDSLSVPDMVQMTVQSYRRSLQEFSESPVMSRCKSLSSCNSLTGAPQSITEWLTLWEKDPVEILLDLGFGIEEPDVCTKIPPRFLSGASVAKGINIRVFLEAQKQRMDIERPNLYERFRQLEVLDHVTSALSSLLTDINTQQTNLLDTTRSRPVVTRVKRRRIGQLLKRASRQTLLLKQGSLAPGEANLPSRKEQPCSSADTAEGGTVQAYSSARVILSCLTQEQTPRDKGTSAYPTSQCSLTPSGEAWAPSHLVAKPLHLSPASEVPAKERPRKEPPLLVAHTLKKVANLNCKLPDSFEMEEIQSFEDETLYRNAHDIALAEVMVTRTSSGQSDSSGFMEELPEPAGFQCTLNEIEAMKSSCQHFQEKLDEIEQHLTEQQALFSSAMPDEGREEARHLQLLRRAVRQEVAELEFQLRDQACQVGESILMQLDQLLAEQSHLFSELGLSDWKGEGKVQNKQTFPDATDTEHPQSGCSEMVLPRAPSKTTTATGSLSGPQLEAPPIKLPTRTMPETNSVKSAPQELSTSAKEIKGTPQAKVDFKAFVHNLKKSFQNSLGNDSAEGKD
ncbi:protein ITPRID1 isoform 4-T4 [Guaruba guarouba]